MSLRDFNVDACNTDLVEKVSLYKFVGIHTNVVHFLYG